MSKLLLSSTPLSPNGGSTDEYETDDYSATDVSSGETSQKLSNGGRSQPRITRKKSNAVNNNDKARSRGGESPRHASNSDSESDCTIPIVGKDLDSNGKTKTNTVASLPKTAATAKKAATTVTKTTTTTTTTTNVGTRKSGRKTTATIKAAAASTIATKKMPTTMAKSQSNVKTTSKNDHTDDDEDDDDDESDSDDDPFADLSRFNESKKRRKIELSSDDDDEEDSDGSDGGTSDEYTSKKMKSKVPNNNKSMKPIVKSSAKGKSAYSSSDDNSSIELLEQTPRKNPATRAATARSPSKKITAYETIQLLSDDDDVICGTFRSPPKRLASNVSATRNGKQETDPSVRAESNAALEIGRLAREKLKAAQNYKAKELDPIPLPSSPPIQRKSVIQRPSVVVVRPSSAVIPPVQRTVSYTGATIQLKLQYTNPVTNKNYKISIKIKMDQPLQHLVDEFTSKQPKLKITSMKFDGDKLDMTKTPNNLDMDDDDMVDAIVVAS
jgi:hypothetical protein